LTSLASSVTCDQLTNGPPFAFDSTTLSGITTPVFTSCVTILGASTNTYSTDQIAALASKATVLLFQFKLKYINIFLTIFIKECL
jgi:hypothetical protein